MAKGEVTPVVSHSFERYTCDTTIYLGFTPILRENTLEVVSDLPSLCSLPPTLREDLRLDGYLKYPMLRRHKQDCEITEIFV
ncbi:hypothetical protein TNCV_2180231 [Trichonephila clavipes]|nr:hypothetical protein TNCV_2180231 [Trichonephila clavipes]